MSAADKCSTSWSLPWKVRVTREDAEDAHRYVALIAKRMEHAAGDIRAVVLLESCYLSFDFHFPHTFQQSNLLVAIMNMQRCAFAHGIDAHPRCESGFWSREVRRKRSCGDAATAIDGGNFVDMKDVSGTHVLVSILVCVRFSRR